MACQGYFDKQKELAQMMRIASYRIHQSLVQKPLSMNEFWPIGDDKTESKKIVWGDTKEEAEEFYKKVKQAHNL